jgi:DGQHR domain-containing protein
MNSARPAYTGAPSGAPQIAQRASETEEYNIMKTLTLPAIQLNQNGSRLILTKMRAADLDDFTIVEAFRHDKPFDASDQGYQRPAEIARVKQFANYLRRGLENPGHVRMPTAILLSGRGSDLSIGSDGTITLKSTNRLPLVDGQHRQRGFQFAIDEKNLVEFADYEVPVVIMQDIDKVEEMRQFATVNGTQKSVRTDLVNMILTQLASREGDDAIVSGQQWKVVVSRVVTRLNNDKTGPWFDRVVMPDMSSYTKEQQAERPELQHRRIVRATSFMASLKPIEAYMADHFSVDKSLDKRADELFGPVDAFWRALRELNPLPFEQAADYVLLKTPGLFALHRVCFAIMKDMYVGRRDWDTENFKLMLKDGRLTEPDFWFAGTAQEDGGEASKYGSMKGFADLADLLIDDLKR